MKSRESIIRANQTAQYSVVGSVISYYSDFDASGVLGASQQASRFSVGFVSSESFEHHVGAAKAEYKNIAGSDLSLLFAPYETVYSRPSGSHGMPHFYESAPSGVSDDIYGENLLPFDYTPSSGGYNFKEVSSNPSGHPVHSIVSSDFYAGRTDQIYDTNVYRGVGLRAPIMIVGWGYDSGGNPMPADESDSSKFKGGYDHGKYLDPKDYIAAPFDVRYNAERGVWEAGGGMSKHRHLKDTAQDGGPAFAGFFRG